MTFTLEQILALSPDDASTKAAQGLVSPGKWPTLAHNAAAIWGECQGSGSKPYQVQIDLAGPAFRCSCPSRKFPCKHGLALFILSVQHASRFAQDAAAPAWVEEWLASRRERSERQDARAAAEPARAPDPAAAARREAKRVERMVAGVDELERWMQDQVRGGIGALELAEPAQWQTLAARMVDAQLPGLALRVRELADLPRDGAWHENVLAGMGRMQLLIDAFRQREALSPAEGADVLAALGVTPAREDVLATGERAGDVWTVLGVAVRERDRLWERQVWLQGQSSGRLALLLDYAHGEPRFSDTWIPGGASRADLVFFPGAAPLRALVDGTPAAAPPTPPRFLSVADNLQWLARQVAAMPWWDTHPFVLAQQTLHAEGGAWWLRSGDGTAMRLACSEDDAWQLLALTGGTDCNVAGTWDGKRLRPLSVWQPHLLWRTGVRA